MTGISRRTVAKGAVWTVPVAAAATAVPAYAVSPPAQFNCLGYFGSSYNEAFGDGVTAARGWTSITWDISRNGVSGNNDPACPAAGQTGVTITYANTATFVVRDYSNCCSQTGAYTDKTFNATYVTGGGPLSVNGLTGNTTMSPIYQMQTTGGVSPVTMGGAATWSWLTMTFDMTVCYGGKC